MQLAHGFRQDKIMLKIETWQDDNKMVKHWKLSISTNQFAVLNFTEQEKTMLDYYSKDESSISDSLAALLMIAQKIEEYHKETP